MLQNSTKKRDLNWSFLTPSGVVLYYVIPDLHIKVSKASVDLMSYCEEHARSDPLLIGIPTSENPFKDKKTCIIL